MKRFRATVLTVLKCTADRFPRSAKFKSILLALDNPVTASYLDRFRRLFSDDHELRFFVAFSSALAVVDQIRCRAILQCKDVPFEVAKFRRWDLVVMADHGSRSRPWMREAQNLKRVLAGEAISPPPIGSFLELLCMPKRFPILRIPHGIGGKAVGEDDYFYGPELFDRNGQLKYTCIFESSQVRREQATKKYPVLQDVIRVVGDLRVDQLRSKAAAARGVITKQERPRVLIASSWNPGNLFERIGAQLIGQATALLDRYAFVLRPHPHLVKSTEPGNWPSFFQAQQKLGLELSLPPTEFDDVLLSSSVVICDDLSSVALYSAMLGKPLILVPSGSSQIPAGSFPARLRELVPKLTDPASLQSALDSVLRNGIPEGMHRLAAEINSRPGESATLIRREVFRLLNLSDRFRGAPYADRATLLPLDAEVE